MSLRIAQPTTRCPVACLLLRAGAIAYGAPPPGGVPRPRLIALPQSLPRAHGCRGQLLEHTLTPGGDRLGQSKADTTLLMRRAAGRSLLYTIHSAWRGIVEYLFPPFGLFHRADVIARVYDPELLSDLERARELMATADVSPLTIAVARRRLEEQSRPVPTAPAQARPHSPSGIAGDQPRPAGGRFHHRRRSTLTSRPASVSRRNCAKRPQLAAQVVSNAMATAREIRGRADRGARGTEAAARLLDKG